jgi:hypothetical protein
LRDGDARDLVANPIACRAGRTSWLGIGVNQFVGLPELEDDPRLQLRVSRPGFHRRRNGLVPPLWADPDLIDPRTRGALADIAGDGDVLPEAGRAVEATLGVAAIVNLQGLVIRVFVPALGVGLNR